MWKLLSLQQALLSQQTLSRFPLMNGIAGAPMPWFPQPAPSVMKPHADLSAIPAAGNASLPPFQVSEFIKHAAQQQLQAQLKVIWRHF